MEGLFTVIFALWTLTLQPVAAMAKPSPGETTSLLYQINCVSYFSMNQICGK